MRFSEAWLREWTNPSIQTNELADQLSMAGLEVDSVEPAAPPFNGVVVGEVLSREQHPDADKLSVCQVNIGADESVQIVCGAQNVAAGMRVPVATLGAHLSPEFKIRKTKLRGVQSMGMICSAAELGLAESSEGIMPLPDDAPIGVDFRAYLMLDDACIEVDLTPDRGDCLSVAGIAREVSVLNQSELSIPAINPMPAQTKTVCKVAVQAPSACPRYLCRVLEGVNPQAETPNWLLERLRRSGIRGISPVVDVTNYVMLELGQPMHGFDLAQIQGGIQVRMAQADEKLRLLDGNEVTLQADTLVIADHAKPLAMAGIMGGAASGVSEATTDILLEAAFFTPLAITGKARTYGLHTDSSHRFERGVDYALQHLAMERATALLLEIVGGQPGPIVEQTHETDLPQRQPIYLRRERITRVLGINIEDATVVDILTRLGMQVMEQPDGWAITAPSARFDMTIEVDLIEEIGRIYGYNKIPSGLSAAPVSMASKPETAFSLDRAKQMLVDRDYQEVITYSFISPDMANLITPKTQAVTLANPISADMSIMRASLWPGLLSTLQYNLARQQERVRIFESGLTFVKEDKLEQKPYLAAAICGTALAEQWGETGRKVDFYDLKGDLEAVLSQLDDPGACTFAATDCASLHPGQSARIWRQGAPIGWIGMLHPEIQNTLSLPTVLLFEIALSELGASELPSFKALSKFPSIRRDLALLVSEAISYQQVWDVARAAAPDIVRSIKLFDVYTGEHVEPGLKSLALNLTLQDSSQTLTDQAVEQATTTVLAALADQLAVKLRD